MAFGSVLITRDTFVMCRAFVDAMAGRRLVRLVLNGEKVVAEEPLLTELNSRIRAVRQRPDGALYMLAGVAAAARRTRDVLGILGPR
jgi:glucose/arabinose dehydrogenase